LHECARIYFVKYVIAFLFVSKRISTLLVCT